MSLDKGLNKRMGDRHEEHVADVMNQRLTRGSGNQWRDQMDSKHDRTSCVYAFANDSKSTLGKSIGVTRAMWEKAVLQAGGERPMLTLRWYDDASLTKVGIDLAACDLLDFAEMREDAERWHKVKPLLEALIEKAPRCVPVLVDLARHLLREAS